MTKQANPGPIISYGERLPLGQGASINPDKAPCTFWGGSILMDPRVGYNRNAMGVQGWLGSNNSVLMVDAAPAALSATNISAAAIPVAATPLTLAGASTGITLNTGGFYSNVSQLTVPAACLVLDGLPSLVGFGRATQGNSSQYITRCYDPTKALERNLRFTSVGNDTTATVAIVGYDFYGVQIHETVTLANAGIASSLRTYKFIQSITPAGTLSGSNLSVGTGDVYGFPLQMLKFMYMEIWYNSAQITATTGFVAAVVSTPTATSGTVRGTYAVQSASDGTKQIQLFAAAIPLASLPNSTGAASLFGQPQF